MLLRAGGRRKMKHALEDSRREEEDFERACCHEVDAAEGREVDG
jgi:hypothetical protein